MRTTFLLAIALPVLMACASTPPPETPARFITCHGDEALAKNGGVRVVLRFTVDESGQPLPGTAVAVRSSLESSYMPVWAVTEAKAILGSCEFEPALRNGQQVASVHSMPMYIPSR